MNFLFLIDIDVNYKPVPVLSLLDDIFRCINLGDSSCVNGGLPGAGRDDGFLTEGNNPGKRSY